MTACDHRMCDDPAGLVCTRDAHPDRGHTYTASSASHLGEGSHHHDPEGDEQ